jgi:Tfp pilus assembly protein PilV
MPDAYFVGFWHRYVQHRGHGRDAGRVDAGITLVELLVAVIILTVGLLGLLAGIATDIRQQAVEKSQAAAIHLADAWFETEQAVADEQNNNNAPNTCVTTCTGNGDALFALYSGSGTTSTQTDQPNGTKGVTYTESRRLVLCAPGKAPSGSPLACTGTAAPPTDKTLAVLYALDTVTWSLGKTGHTLTLERDLSDDNQRVVSNPSAALGNCGGTVAIAGTPTLTLKALSSTNATLAVLNPASPATQPRVDVSDAGIFGNLDGTTGTANVVAKVFVDLTVPSNENATCIPLQWTDINGGHEVQLAKSGGSVCLSGNDYCATITANPNIEQTATSSTTSTAYAFAFNNSVTFSATVPGYTNAATADQVSASMNVIALPTMSNCQVTVLGGVLFNLNQILGGVLGPLVGSLLTGIVNGVATLGNGLIAGTVAATTFECTVDNRLSTNAVQVQYTDCKGGSNTTSLSLAGATASNSPATWLVTLPAQATCPASAPRKPPQSVTLLSPGGKDSFTFSASARSDGKSPAGFPAVVQAEDLD